MAELVQQIAAVHNAFERQRHAVAGELTRLQQEMALHEQTTGQTALPELPEGGRVCVGRLLGAGWWVMFCAPCSSLTSFGGKDAGMQIG